MLSGVTMLIAQPAFAQNSFDGFRLEGDIGLDRFYSEGNHDNHLAFGAEAGYDFAIGDTAIVGPYVTYTRHNNENITRDGPGIAARKSFEEYSGGLRAGAEISPGTLVYGKLGITLNEQRKRFTGDIARASYYNHYNTWGYQAGLGIERNYGSNLYIKAEGRYANYRTNSSRITALLGFGVRFGPADVVEEVAPPPPPPPAPEPVPASQTCPDGSVILATDVCPAPPPPPEPAPVPSPGERGR